MTITKDLFLSILAMDAYNRGYDEGIENLGGIGSRVGSATISTDSETLSLENDDFLSDGFYALTYTVDGSNIEGWTGETEVLSFRGTNSSRDWLAGWRG